MMYSKNLLTNFSKDFSVALYNSYMEKEINERSFVRLSADTYCSPTIEKQIM